MRLLPIESNADLDRTSEIVDTSVEVRPATVLVFDK